VSRALVPASYFIHLQYARGALALGLESETYALEVQVVRPMLVVLQKRDIVGTV
jgi:hypothetical protein